jgi:hypothetical protein
MNIKMPSFKPSFPGPEGQEDMPYLLTPGPLTTSRTVKLAMLADWGSREVEVRKTLAISASASCSWPRNVGTHANAACKGVVALGALDKPRIAAFREVRPVVRGHIKENVVVAAIDENVGHGIAKRTARRNGEEMALIFVARDFCEVVFAKPPRLQEDGARDFDCVVIGKTENGVEGRPVERRQAARKLDARLGFDFAGEPDDQVVEQLDLLVAQFLGAAGE